MELIATDKAHFAIKCGPSPSALPFSSPIMHVTGCVCQAEKEREEKKEKIALDSTTVEIGREWWVEFLFVRP